MELRTVGLRDLNEGWFDIGVLMSNWGWFNKEPFDLELELLWVEKDNVFWCLGLSCFWFGKDNGDGKSGMGWERELKDDMMKVNGFQWF